MGFGNSDRKTYTTISDGKLFIKCDENEFGQPGVVEKVKGANSPNAGQKYYGRVFDNYDGLLTGLEVKDGQYGRELLIEMDNSAVIQCSFKSPHAEEFMSRLANLELDKVVYLRPYSFLDDKKKLVTGWTIMQRGKKVAPACAFRKKDGTPNYPDLPIAPDKEMVDIGEAKPKLVNKKRMDWMVEKYVEPMIQFFNMQKAAATGAANTTSQEYNTPPEFEDGGGDWPADDEDPLF